MHRGGTDPLLNHLIILRAIPPRRAPLRIYATHSLSTCGLVCAVELPEMPTTTTTTTATGAAGTVTETTTVTLPDDAPRSCTYNAAEVRWFHQPYEV